LPERAFSPDAGCNHFVSSWRNVNILRRARVIIRTASARSKARARFAVVLRCLSVHLLSFATRIA
jgi:hypothetical protein